MPLRPSMCRFCLRIGTRDDVIFGSLVFRLRGTIDHLTRVIIRVHILLRPSADDGNTARDREGEATLFEDEGIAEVGGGCASDRRAVRGESNSTRRTIQSSSGAVVVIAELEKWGREIASLFYRSKISLVFEFAGNHFV